MIALTPMTTEAFAVYVERAVTEYAQDKVDSGQWSRDASLALARSAYEELLPGGSATPHHHLFSVRDSETGSVVGMLWYAVQERAGRNVAYVYDVQIEPQHQRKGFATATFLALEQQADAQGLAGVELHVFGHRPAAQALYAKLGFRTTNIIMFKEIPGAAP